MRTALFRHGFTLVELAVVIGITAIIVVATVPLYSFFQTYSSMNSSKAEVVQHMRLTETLARSDRGGSAYGIKFEPHQYTIFRGLSYAARTPSQDRLFTIPSNITLSGITEIIFTQHTGLPSTAGTLTLTHAQSDTTETITINALGLIE